MANFDLKTATPDTSIDGNAFLFGADSQSASDPSVYQVSTITNYIVSLANSWTAAQTITPLTDAPALTVRRNSGSQTSNIFQVQTESNGALASFNKEGCLTINGTTVTASTPVIDAAQTWNASGTTFTGLKFNATDTASASGSLLMDLQKDGGSLFTVGKNLSVSMAGSLNMWTGFTVGSGTLAAIYDVNAVLGSNRFFGFSSTAAVTSGIADAALTRRAAANLRFGAADAAAPVAQTLSVQSVVAGTSNTAGANLTITGSQGTGTGAGGSIIFQVAPAGSSGTAQNALATAWTVDSASRLIGSSGGTAAAPALSLPSDTGLFAPTTAILAFSLAGVERARFEAQLGFGLVRDSWLWWSNNQTNSAYSNRDLILARDAANTLALRNATAAQAFRVYNTFTSATNFERANIFWDSNVLKIGTEKGSAGGTARALELQTDGTTRLTIATDGAFTFSGTVNASDVRLGTAGNLRTRYISTPTNTVNMFEFEASGTTGNLVYAVGATSPIFRFAGTTSSFPALKRSSASLIVRLADDTANAALESASLKTDAPAGGTAATWKLGTVASVSPTSPNRTIEVDIGGTIYYISAKTTND